MVRASAAVGSAGTSAPAVGLQGPFSAYWSVEPVGAAPVPGRGLTAVLTVTVPLSPGGAITRSG